MTDIIKNNNILMATCKVLANIDWFGNYKLYNINEKDFQYVSEATNIEDYFNRFIEIVKDRILRNISDINNIKWDIKGFDESISLHYFVREVAKILEKFIKVKLAKKYPYYAYHIDKHNINFDKTIVIQITNNDKIILLATICIEHFL